MTQLESVLQKLRKREKEHYRFIAGRYKPIDGFVLRVSWFVYGILTGLTIAGIIAGISH